MAKLIYSAIASLDGYIEDEQGKFGWAEPDEEVHAFANELQRPVGTYLYGRRMYETMAAWETLGVAGQPSVLRGFGELWRGADKIVYSTTLQSVSTARTRLERRFDPDIVRQLKAAVAKDLAVGGAALRRGLRRRPRRRAAPVPRTRAGRRWQAGAPQGRPPTARTGGRAIVLERLRVSAVPRQPGSLRGATPSHAGTERRCGDRLSGDQWDRRGTRRPRTWPQQKAAVSSGFEEPTRGFEPRTPSLRVKCSTS
jgi:dihydrofolate reductase